jgi:hypothetical protein
MRRRKGQKARDRSSVRRAVQQAMRQAVRRVGPVAACAPLCLLLVGGSAIAATTRVTPFVPAPQPVVWAATMPDGTPVNSTVTIDKAEVGTAAQLPPDVALHAGQTCFYVALHPNHAYGNDPQTPVPMPATPATLTTSTGTVTGIPVTSSSFAVDGAWYFPLQSTATTVTLQVATFTRVLGNERGDFGPWTFTPSPITFVATHLAAPPATAHSGRGSATAASAQTAAGSTALSGRKSAGTSIVVLGAGAVGVVALGAATAGTVIIRRRRAFARADREGRVVLSGPPALVAGAAGLAGTGVSPGRQRIVVKLLGPLIVDGTRHTVTAGPLLEIITFLALHPGQDFTSVQLRESIWGLGRQPITANTFRKYLVQFRKAFGTGVLVTDVYRYELTDTVTSDWDQFRALVAAGDKPSRRQEALGLVRGPVLHGCFDGRKNSPFSWAYDTANRIEDEVTTVSFNLAMRCLEYDDPEGAGSAVAQGLLCSNTNFLLRMVDLDVGAVAGGPRELGRRLAAGRAAMATFPNDVLFLEERARDLGWTPKDP